MYITILGAFTVSITFMRPAQLSIGAKALAVGLEKSDEDCICQADFENDCSGTHDIIDAVAASGVMNASGT